MTTTADKYHVTFGGENLTTGDFLGWLARGEAEVHTWTVAFRQMTEPVQPVEEEVAELMAWLEQDGLDWDAVARARRHGW